jgi:hypothetical protein
LGDRWCGFFGPDLERSAEKPTCDDSRNRKPLREALPFGPFWLGTHGLLFQHRIMLQTFCIVLYVCNWNRRTQDSTKPTIAIASIIFKHSASFVLPLVAYIDPPNPKTAKTKEGSQ